MSDEDRLCFGHRVPIIPFTLQPFRKLMLIWLDINCWYSRRRFNKNLGVSMGSVGIGWCGLFVRLHPKFKIFWKPIEILYSNFQATFYEKAMNIRRILLESKWWECLRSTTGKWSKIKNTILAFRTSLETYLKQLFRTHNLTVDRESIYNQIRLNELGWNELGYNKQNKIAFWFDSSYFRLLVSWF